MTIIKEPMRIEWMKIVRVAATLLVLAFIFINSFLFGGTIKHSWREMKFAYDKPEMVKAMRESYKNKIVEVEESFKPTPTPTVTPSPSPTPAVEVSKK